MSMREITTLPLEERGLRHRLARLRPRTVQQVRSATGKSIGCFARGVELAIVVVGWALLPVLPLLAAALTRDVQYARRYPTTLLQVTRHIRATWRGRALSRMLVRKLEPAALGRPQHIVGTCTHCGNCCLYRSCVFLRFDDAGRSSCRIYGTRLWKRLTCGEYPVDAYEIDLYRCPSFTASKEPAPSMHRVIPLVPAGHPSRADEN
jgi:hypothetical protein